MINPIRQRFISDVLYGLKHEYGEPLFLCRESSVVNSDTGLKTISKKSIRIPKAIPLPVNLRLAFLKSLNIQRVGVTEEGTSEVLLDRKGILDISLVKNASYILDSKNRKRRVKKIDDYDAAFILTVNDSVENPNDFIIQDDLNLNDSLVVVKD